MLANLCGEPHLLPSQLMNRATELENVKLFHARPFGEFIGRYHEPGMDRHIRCITAFAGGVKPIVQLIKEGKADFYPIPLSKFPWLFKEGPYKPDVFMTTVTPPDSNGYCSLGVSVDYARAAMQTADTVIAEVNENMPRTCGDSLVNISQIDYLVEANERIYEMPPAKITNLEKRLGENVAGLVEDEATIQIGFGGVSEAIASFLTEKKDLHAQRNGSGKHHDSCGRRRVDLQQKDHQQREDYLHFCCRNTETVRLAGRQHDYGNEASRLYKR